MGVMRTIWGGWPDFRWSSAAHEEVELLVGAAEFYIALEGYGVIALGEGV